MIQTVKMSVRDAYEEKAAKNAQVTGEQLKQMLGDEHQAPMVQLIDDKHTELKNEVRDFSSCAGWCVQQQDGGSDTREKWRMCQFANMNAQEV